jgi:hypothetical protein
MNVMRKESIDVTHTYNVTYHHFVFLKLTWLLKSPFDQNSIMIYHKFNGDFKSHINFGRIKGGQKDDM